MQIREKLCVSCSVVSNSLRLHELWSTRLLSPWSSPGKNTRVGFHFLLRGIFQIHGMNLDLLHWRQILHHLSHQGSLIKIICHDLISLKYWTYIYIRKSSVQSLSRVRLFATPWIVARQASLPITSSRSSLKLMSIESVMPSSPLILCRPLLLLPPVPLSIRVFSSESTLRMRWPKYWSFSFSVSPSNEHPGLISFRINWLDLLAVQGTLKSLLQTTVQKHQFFSIQLSL